MLHERVLQKEGEHTFHRERLSDYSTGVTREVRPIRSELKFHGNSGDDTDGEIEPKDFGPKPNCSVVFFVTSSKGAPFPVNQEPSQPHRELRKQVVVDDREPEL